MPKALSISDFDIGDMSSCCSEIGDEEEEEEGDVTTPQIEEMESKMLVFGSKCSSTSGCLSSDCGAVSSPDADDVTLKESLPQMQNATKASSKVHRFTPDSVIKKRSQPKYHHSNSSAMASSLQGINMFGRAPLHVAAGEALVATDGSGRATPDIPSSHDDSF